MRNFLTESAMNLRQGGIRAFFDKAKNYSDVINLGIGEPDLDTPRPVIDAAYQSMLEGHTHYTANAGDLPLPQAKTWVTVTAQIRVEERKQYKGLGPVLYAMSIEPASEPEEEVVTFNY